MTRAWRPYSVLTPGAARWIGLLRGATPEQAEQVYRRAGRLREAAEWVEDAPLARCPRRFTSSTCAAAAFGVSHRTVLDIWSGRTWGNVTGIRRTP